MKACPLGLALSCAALLAAVPSPGLSPVDAKPPAGAGKRLPTLLDALDDDDLTRWSQAWGALFSAVEFGDVKALLKAASEDKRLKVRRGALGVLWKFASGSTPPPKQAVSDVTALLLRRVQDEDADTRRLAVHAAAAYAKYSPKLVPAVIKALSDKDVGVPGRGSVALAAAAGYFQLGTAGRPGYGELIRVAREGDRAVRVGALQSIGRLAALDKGHQPLLLGCLIEALLTAKPEDLRYEAAEALRPCRADARPAIPALREAFIATAAVNEIWARERRRSNVLAALAAIGPDSKAALPDVIPLLLDNTVESRTRKFIAELAGGLKEYGAPAAGALRRVALDESETKELRAAAKTALKAIPSPEPPPH